MLGLNILVVILTALLLPQQVRGTCTPSDVKTDLIRCLQYQGLNTFYHFPIVPSASYNALCTNATCVAYCMETIIRACQAETFMFHLGDGAAIKAAYIGLCAETETDTKAALACTAAIDNQAALNDISVFETAWQGYYDNNNPNNDTLCSNWTTLKTNLDALVSSTCTGSVIGKSIWDSFLNTMLAHCTMLTPSFYTNYSETSVQTCNWAPDVSSWRAAPLVTLLLGLLFLIPYS